MLSHPPSDPALSATLPAAGQSRPEARPKGSPPGARLTIALAKGRLTAQTLRWLERAGLPMPALERSQGPESGSFLAADRRLILPSQDGTLRYIMAKPADVPIYVEYGAADLGVCGLDVLREGERRVYEPLLLPFGYCRLSLAGPAGRTDSPLRYDSQPRVATTFPRLTGEFFRTRGINAEIIALKGSVELGPLVGLADLIVDLVDTGNTLRENGLVELRVIMLSQAVLIANRASYRLKSQPIQQVIQSLRTAIDQSKNISP